MMAAKGKRKLELLTQSYPAEVLTEAPPTEDSDDQGSALESAENKAEKNRERNREHAKRTRQRKKEMLEGMKMRLLELQREVEFPCFDPFVSILLKAYRPDFAVGL